jgi:signal peptidase II
VKKSFRLLFLISAGVIILDQITKWMILKTIPVYESYPIIQGFFHLVHVRNRGVAFGIMNRPGSQVLLYLLILMTLAAVVLLAFWLTRLGEKEGKIALGLSLVIGGALGNLIDRVRMGEVLDFLDFHIGGYHWPAFNVADSAVTVGVVWLALNILFSRDAKGEGRKA